MLYYEQAIWCVSSKSVRYAPPFTGFIQFFFVQDSRKYTYKSINLPLADYEWIFIWCSCTFHFQNIKDYEKRLRLGVASHIPFIIDKHPINFIHIGLISILFPKARIIHCTRNPLDTCLSNYFQYFSPQYHYSFGLQNIAHFYLNYLKLMDYWRHASPLKILEINYEELVSNMEPVARKAIDFLGLEWDERCLTPHTNPRPIKTASVWQVRQPVYNKSIERWRHYEKHLETLKNVLGNICA